MSFATSQKSEEAVTVASEFISSLDNLPREVQHLLQEIRHKESRSQELQQEIGKESSRYIRHVLRHPNGHGSGGATPLSPSPTTENSKAHLPPRIASSYAEIDRLATEKIALAERIVELLARTRTRLDVDLARIGVLEGKVEATGRGGSVGASESHSRHGLGTISESLRQALAGTVDSPAGSTVGSGQKKRRIGSIKLPSPAPVSAPPGRSRLSRQAQPAPGIDEDMDDIDAEGEEDVEEGEEEGDEEGEDKGIYCFCQKMSYGEMVACDGKDCPYQWFHLPCVNLKGPLPDSFICDYCLSRGRKGRKKQG